MTDKDVLYQTDSTDLKLADRNRRVLRAILIFLLDIVILYAVVFVQLVVFHVGNLLISMIVFLILSALLLPSPILIIPTRYRVLSTGIDSDGKRLFPLKPNYLAKVNEKRGYVSIFRPRRGEFIRLYSAEPRKLQNAIQKVTHRKKDKQQRLADHLEFTQ
jgi:uncharacterized membrane protein